MCRIDVELKDITDLLLCYCDEKKIWKYSIHIWTVENNGGHAQWSLPWSLFREYIFWWRFLWKYFPGISLSIGISVCIHYSERFITDSLNKLTSCHFLVTHRWRQAKKSSIVRYSRTNYFFQHDDHDLLDGSLKCLFHAIYQLFSTLQLINKNQKMILMNETELK